MPPTDFTLSLKSLQSNVLLKRIQKFLRKTCFLRSMSTLAFTLPYSPVPASNDQPHRDHQSSKRNLIQARNMRHKYNLKFSRRDIKIFLNEINIYIHLYKCIFNLIHLVLPVQYAINI